MSKLGWCMTGHHHSCPETILTGNVCSCGCHAEERIPVRPKLEEAAVPPEGIRRLLADAPGIPEAVSLGLDGVSYVAELNEQQAAELRESLAPYIEAARRVVVHKTSPEVSVRASVHGRAENWTGAQLFDRVVS
ncbi:histone-like nucleoid-structuring protein Lsr2 [Streptomyces sp. NPDC058701]|uniref:Lsr2 dimerization domain-containing protein n=1 Tax=Streptomyces sp. NPDC058701 TaxID=3346608 RepID=UPI00364D8A7E